ncbi:MAG: 4Fe-4S binding protein [Acidimicrobiales bacterium]
MELRERPSETSSTTSSPPPDPVAVAIRLRPAIRTGVQERFAPSDPPKGWDISKYPKVARVLRSRKFQFAMILPNQIIFWLVIVLGLLGTVVPGLNFGTAITWYIWFCLVFVMMVVVGRAWCVMCPFGGFAEWIQRRAFWRRSQRRLGLGRKLPEPIARYGFLISVGSFIVLTWIEEYFNIAGPGNPWATSFMVLGIVASALLFFLVFERRTFCRYFCPLTALIGTVGAMGSVAGYRTKDRELCLSCATKDCMRGGVNGYGCPWYTWPGSADSNLACGLCSECYKGCPEGNIGLFLQKPMTSVVAPTRRRADVAWAVALLWGLVVFQQVNATTLYATIDGWLNKVTGLAYPNPIDYLGTIGLVALATAGLVKLAQRYLLREDVAASTTVYQASDLEPSVTAGAQTSSSFSRASVVSSIPVYASVASTNLLNLKGSTATSESFITKTSSFRLVFLPLMYGLIPVVGADYFARQLPKFFKHASRIIPDVGNLFGAGGVHSTLYNMRLLSNPGIVAVQVVVIVLGMLASIWATWKIADRELLPISQRPAVIRIVTLALPLLFGIGAALLYVIMHAAS